MKRLQKVLLFLLFCSCGKAQILTSGGTEAQWTTYREERQIQIKAQAGDIESAWKLYGILTWRYGQERAGNYWLKRAAQHHHPQAQRMMAFMIKSGNLDYRDFGDSPTDAVENLLTESAYYTGDACFELAEAYTKGDFGKPDPVMARMYLERGACFGDRLCWKYLAKDLFEGKNGPRDYVTAYFWISLETRCVDPRSFGGKEEWALREQIAQHVQLPELEKQWGKIDSYIDKVRANTIKVDYAPFQAGTIDPAISKEGPILADRKEEEHRTNLRHREPKKAD